MKLLSTVALMAAALAVVNAQTAPTDPAAPAPTDPAPAPAPTPKQQLYVLILKMRGQKLSDKLLEALVKKGKDEQENDNEQEEPEGPEETDPAPAPAQVSDPTTTDPTTDPSAEEPEDPNAQEEDSNGQETSPDIEQWLAKCVTGRYSAMRPELKALDPAEAGVEPKQFGKVDFKNPKAAEKKKMRDAIKTAIRSWKLEHKIYFISDAETMAKPECQLPAIQGLFHPIGNNTGDLFEVSKFEPVNVDLTTCTKTDASGNVIPVCGDFSASTQPADYTASQNCPACSITSNGILASTVAAAALVAMTLFF